MLAMPTSSPQMTRILGLRPDAAAAGAGAAAGARRGFLGLRQRAGCQCRRGNQRRGAKQNIAAAEGAVVAFVR